MIRGPHICKTTQVDVGTDIYLMLTVLAGYQSDVDASSIAIYVDIRCML